MNVKCNLSRWHAAVAVMVTLNIALIATGMARADEPIPALPGRAWDSRVGEPMTMTRVQQRLDALIAAGASDCVTVYEAEKAQAWLNFAKYAAQNAVPAPVTAAALGDAGAVLSVAERRGSPAMDTFELPGSRHLRDDLWRAVRAVKADGRLCGAPKMTAYCEVQLAWVGYEASAGGWRHVDPYVRIAEDYCITARDAEAVPMPPRVAVRDTVAAPSLPDSPVEIAPEDRPAPDPVAVERIDVSLFVLFPHDRAARGDIRAPGRAQLARLAAHLKSLPEDTLVTITGHADITGKPGYNEKLSARRAQTVALELESHGVDPARLTVSAMGSAAPVVKCPRAQASAGKQEYLACLEPNRRVVVHLIDDFGQ